MPSFGMSLPAPAFDEVDLRESLSFFRRRWKIIAIAGIIGLTYSFIDFSIRKSRLPSVQLALRVNTLLSPCKDYVLDKVTEQSTLGSNDSRPDYTILCEGEFEISRTLLEDLAHESYGESEKSKFEVKSLVYSDRNTKTSSGAILRLKVISNPNEILENRKRLQIIKDRFIAAYPLSTLEDSPASRRWLYIEPERKKIQHSFIVKENFTFLLVIVILSVISALIVDIKANRVWKSRDLKKVRYPLVLNLPQYPWDDNLIEPLLKQAADNIDESNKDYICSIGIQHPCILHLVDLLNGYSTKERFKAFHLCNLIEVC